MLRIKKAVSDADIQKCLDIRFRVFVEGQCVPISQELDGKDAESEHYLLFIDEHPVGVARVRSIDDFFKIERVGILDEYQGKRMSAQKMPFSTFCE